METQLSKKQKTTDDEELQSISLKLLVDKKNNQVVFAESSKDFVDVLFSFMTIPIGTIIKLIGQQSFGCMGNLYASVKNLDEEFLQSQKCRDLLLQPRSAADIFCRNLKVNLNETDGSKYYACNGACSRVSYYQTGHCRCGKIILYELKLSSPINLPQEGGVFMKSTSWFMVSSDFHVKPISTMTGLSLLSKLGAGDGSTLEERTVKVEKDKVLELLKCSLVSRKPLTEAFLDPFPVSKTCGNFSPGVNGLISRHESQQRVTNSTMKGANICVKLIVNRVKNRVLYAEVAEDFVHLLCSFLTYPLGYLFEHFPCLTFKGCTDNLYKSIQDIEDKPFESAERKEMLLHSKLAPGLAHVKLLLSVEEAVNPSHMDLVHRFKAVRTYLGSNYRNEEAKITDGFIKGPSNFMVMDSLTVVPLSSISGISLIKGAQIPLSDIAEKEVVMGEDEALRLFKASLVSRNALTDAFLLKEIKQEQ